MPQYVFYDIPSKGRAICWSPNTWKTRLALNFKGVDYETRWVEYPDIQSTLSAHVEANVVKSSFDMPYTLPAVEFPDGTWIMESKRIANQLEADQVSPSLRLDDPSMTEVEELLLKIKDSLRGVWQPKVPYNLLNEQSKTYFLAARGKSHGKPLEQVARETGGEEAWIAALPSLKLIGEVLKKEGGPFVAGKNAGYVDLEIVAFLHFIKLVEEDIYQRVIKIEPTLQTLYEASQTWLERNDH